MERLLDRLQQRAADMTDDKLLAELARELSRTGDAELAGTVTASAVQVLPFARSPCQEVAAPAAVAITAGARSSGKKARNSKSTGGNGGADAGLARSDVAAQRSGSAEKNSWFENERGRRRPVPFGSRSGLASSSYFFGFFLCLFLPHRSGVGHLVCETFFAPLPKRV
jgi:hypothetical protein